jgi:hypothetical protein
MIAVLYERRPLQKNEINSICNLVHSFNRHQVHYKLCNKIALLFNSSRRKVLVFLENLVIFAVTRLNRQ